MNNISKKDLSEYVENGHSVDIVVIGDKYNGFSFRFFIQINENDSIEGFILNCKGNIKYIRCPELTHKYIKTLGFKKYYVNTVEWCPKMFYDPHQHSQDSRLRRKNQRYILSRDEVVSNGGVNIK